MKKNVSKKLTLKKSTIAALNIQETKGVIGGGATTEPPCPISLTCNTCDQWCDTTTQTIQTETDYSRCDCLTVGTWCN